MPTLCNAFPAFEGMKRVWKNHQFDHPETYNIVQKGLDKLEEYRDYAGDVPAYILAMCMCQFTFILCYLVLSGVTNFKLHVIVVNPSIKLNWHEKYELERVNEVKQTVIHEVL